MIKMLAATAIAAFIAAALFVLPGFAPAVKAEAPAAFQKSSRVVIQLVDRDCAGQNWPNFSAACLFGSGAKLEPRLVSADRG